MTTPPKGHGVLYLDKHAMTIMVEGRNDTVRIEVPPTIINDMEVINDAGLGTLLSAFITQKNIAPTNLIIILSRSIVFEKNITSITSIERADEIQGFLDLVPFDENASHIYDIGGTSVIAATNTDLINKLRIQLKQLGFTVHSVIPISALGRPYSAKLDLDLDTARLVLKRFDELKAMDMADADEPAEGSYFRLDNTPTAQSKKNLPVLVSVFALLLGVLGFLLWMQRTTPTSTKAAAPTPTAALPIPSPIPTLAPAIPPVSSAAASLSPFALSITIRNGSGSPILADTVKTKLTAAGFRNIQMIVMGTIAARPSVGFSKSVPTDARAIITTEVLKLAPQASVQDTADNLSDVVITLGKP